MAAWKTHLFQLAEWSRSLFEGRGEGWYSICSGQVSLVNRLSLFDLIFAIISTISDTTTSQTSCHIHHTPPANEQPKHECLMEDHLCPRQTFPSAPCLQCLSLPTVPSRSKTTSHTRSDSVIATARLSNTRPGHTTPRTPGPRAPLPMPPLPSTMKMVQTMALLPDLLQQYTPLRRDSATLPSAAVRT